VPRTSASHTQITHRRTTAHRSAAKRPRPRSSKGRKASRAVRGTLISLGIFLLVATLCIIIYLYVIAPFTSSRWQAIYGKEAYPEGYSIHGIDVSHHQGNINWSKLQAANISEEPVSFVFIKATEGRSLLDENFNDNFYQAREYGFLRGAYHYFKPAIPAREQAEYFLRQVHLEEGDLPPVLDIEEAGGQSPKQLQRAALTWLRLVEKRYGVPPIIYTSYKFKQKYLNTADFNRYPYWIAHYYVRSLSYKGAWKFWQHTDRGQLPGIKSHVDFNIYNGSMYDLKRLCIQ